MGSPEVSSSSTIGGFDEFIIPISHPFYVHPSDSPSTHLVSPPLMELVLSIGVKTC